MQARLSGTAQGEVRLVHLRTQLVQAYAAREKRLAITGISGVNGGHIRCRQRIGEDGQRYAPFGNIKENLNALFAGNEVRGCDVQAVACRLQQGQQAFHQEVVALPPFACRFFRRIGKHIHGIHPVHAVRHQEMISVILAFNALQIRFRGFAFWQGVQLAP